MRALLARVFVLVRSLAGAQVSGGGRRALQAIRQRPQRFDAAAKRLSWSALAGARSHVYVFLPGLAHRERDRRVANSCGKIT
ncbi:MAG: hypothetical protein ACT4P0_04430 [Panacagrimonas sp.]